MRKVYIGSRIFDGQSIYVAQLPVVLPDGCVGVLFAFESEDAAKKVLGDDADLVVMMTAKLAKEAAR